MAEEKVVVKVEEKEEMGGEEEEEEMEEMGIQLWLCILSLYSLTSTYLDL